MYTLSITDTNIFTALSSWIQSVLPVSQNQVVKEMINRVSTPKPPYIQLNHLNKTRLATTTNTYADISTTITGSISGTILTIISGTGIMPGMWISGEGIALNTNILSIGEATNTFNLNIDNGTIPSTSVFGYYNGETLQDSIDYVLQIDCYGEIGSDWISMLELAYRSTQAVDFFSPYLFAPLYSEAPVHIPFLNREGQWEERWIMRLHLQYNPTLISYNQSATSCKIVLDRVQNTQ
jgi:hypothetical protein